MLIEGPRTAYYGEHKQHMSDELFRWYGKSSIWECGWDKTDHIYDLFGTMERLSII